MYVPHWLMICGSHVRVEIVKKISKKRVSCHFLFAREFLFNWSITNLGGVRTAITLIIKQEVKLLF